MTERTEGEGSACVETKTPASGWIHPWRRPSSEDTCPFGRTWNDSLPPSPIPVVATVWVAVEPAVKVRRVRNDSPRWPNDSVAASPFASNDVKLETCSVVNVR